MALPLTFGGHAMELLADRAIYWPAANTLIVADLHVGKASVFRARGLPVPTGITSKDLARLTTLVQQTAAERVLILGDFLHAKESHDAATHVEQWRDRHRDVAVEIVPGNHDRTVGLLDPALKFVVHGGTHAEAGLMFTHDPAEVHDLPVLAGHLHPQARLGDFDGSGASVPCFSVETGLLILPAFGTFTGGYRLCPTEDRRLFVAAAGRVVELTAAASSSGRSGRRAAAARAGGAGRTTRASR